MPGLNLNRKILIPETHSPCFFSNQCKKMDLLPSVLTQEGKEEETKTLKKTVLASPHVHETT